MNKLPKNNVIAFDFDGVIARYAGFKGDTHAYEPISGTVETIKKLKEAGYKILIHSTRGNDFLKEYCLKYNIPVDYFNRNPEVEGENTGKPIAHVYVDDRAITFTNQSTDELFNTIVNFKTYWQTGDET